jgi:CRISPR-associated helicase Cas3
MSKHNEFKVEIDGIALKQDVDEVDNWLPEVEGQPQYPPYKHQVETRDLIENVKKFIATNSTVTGGGKTESYAIPVMNNDLFTIVLFPTNALTTDQMQSITNLRDNYYEDKDVYIKQLTADSMQDYREKQRKKGNLSQASLRNGEQIRQSLIQAQRNDGPSFILMNPDIFTEILTDSYGSPVKQHLKMADMVVVDEFHNARPKGKYTLILHMDKLYHQTDDKCNLKKFIFLSATPDEKLSKHLESKFGFSDDDIYYHIDSKDDCKSISELSLSDSEPYNPVMPKVNTTFVGARAFSTKDKILSKDYFSRITDFVDSSGRSIIILDSISEVNDVYLALKEHLPHLNIQRVTGLTSKGTHNKLQNSDVLLGNSTLEVGVDIENVEQLVFTGFNASSFMQRLGRLRAEPGKIEKAAVCFTKPDALESFKSFKELETPSVPRDLLHSTVNRQLSKEADVSIYRSYFTPIEFYHSIINEAENMTNGNEYKRDMSKLVIKHCYEDAEHEMRQSDVQKLWQLAQTQFGKAMQSYRQSSITALLYDERDECVKTYPVASLLRLGDVEFLTESEFDHRLKSVGIDDPSLYDGEKQYVHAYAWLNGFQSGDILRNPHLAPTDQIQHMIGQDPKERYPILVRDVEYTVENNGELEGISKLNKELHKNLQGEDSSDIVGYVTEGHPAQIQSIYDLDDFFFTNPIANMNGNYTMAIGENAQYLYCHVQENISAAEALYRKANL